LREAIHSDQDIQRVARELYARLPDSARIIGITLYKLQPKPTTQLSLNQATLDRQDQVCAAEDKINYRFGARKIHSADTLGTAQVKTKIPFGSVRYLDHALN
jgi:hypothetical protein